MALINIGKTTEEKGVLNAIESNYAVISFEPSGKIINANQNFLDALGYSKDEIISKHHRIFCEQNYTQSSLYTEFWNNLSNGISQIGEFKRIKKDGSSIWIQASYTPVKDKSGNTVRVVKFAQDITNQKIQTFEYESKLDAISKSQAVIEFSMDGTILKANNNFLNTLGYVESEIIGKKHSMFCEESYKNSSEYTQFWRKLNEGLFDSGEYLRIGKNNKQVWIQASYNPILDLNGNPYKVVKFATNITKRKNMIFDVQKTSSQFSSSVDNLFASAKSMAQGAAQTGASTEQASVSIDNVSQSSSDVTNKVVTMLESINNVIHSSKKGKDIAIQAKDKSEITSNAITKLDLESEKIDDTIRVISQIAFQTNILSLNAAVEAATAGEAGKGFAVVAQEVRNLATRSDDAAKQITEVVATIQGLVKESLDSVKEISEVMEEMSTISSTIYEEVEKQNIISKDVSSIMNETSTQIIEITKAMQNVAQNASQSGKESQVTLDSTQNIANLTKELLETLDNLINNLD